MNNPRMQCSAPGEVAASCPRKGSHAEVKRFREGLVGQATVTRDWLLQHVQSIKRLQGDGEYETDWTRAIGQRQL
jgi:hypothetical protein